MAGDPKKKALFPEDENHALHPALPALDKLRAGFGLKPGGTALIVDPSSQHMFLIDDDKIKKIYAVSTASRGLGCVRDSFQTPIGAHAIKEKIGQGQEPGTVFKGRTPQGKTRIYHDKTRLESDFITTRILWLEGLEPGVNQGKNSAGQTVDSHERYIYIHGTNEEGLIGQPASHGCIRMKNQDMIELFEIVPARTLVEILNKPFTETR